MSKDDSCLVVGDFSLRLDPNDNDPKSKEVAERELRETPEVRDAAVATLKKLIAEEKDLNFPLSGPDGENILLRFLRPCKFYPESAWKKMKKFYAFKYNEPSLSADFQNEGDRSVFEQGFFGIIPARDQHGRMICRAELGGKWDPSKCSLHDYMRALFLVLDGLTVSSSVQRIGVNLIIDCDGIGWSHLKAVSPTIAMKTVHYLQDCEPSRLKSIHIVNNSYIFSLVFAIFKPFISEKLKKRIHMHGNDRQSFLQHIEPRALPANYGGTLDQPQIDKSRLFNFLACYKKFYLDTASVKYTTKPK